METGLDPALLDALYEAAVVSELWPAALGRIGEIAATPFVGLLAFDADRHLRFTSTPEYAPGLASFSAVSHRYENPRPRRALASRHAGFLIDLDLFTAAELENDPVFRDFVVPNGWISTAGTVIPVPTSDLLVFDLARKASAGPFERTTMRQLDAYRPHLARAALLAHRFGLQTARNATDAMRTLGLPACALSDTGRVVAANGLFDVLSPRIRIGAFDRVSFEARRANDLLEQAIAALSSDETHAARSVPIAAVDAEPALIVHLLPVRLGAHDIFVRGATILVVTAVRAPEAPLTELLHGLFDLTPAESRVARALASGLSIDEISVRSAASRETVRTQLKGVMSKTATHRQVDLVRLLAGARPVPDGPFDPFGHLA